MFLNSGKLKTLLSITLIFLILISGCVSNGEDGRRGAKGDKGDKGDTLFLNGSMNQTPNQTAGYTPVFGVDYFNGTNGIDGMMNQTINQTINQTMNQSTADLSPYYFLNGTRLLTGQLNAGMYNLSNVTNPVSPQDVATKNYVDAVGQSWQTWTPTYTWSVNPSNPTGISRYTQSGRKVAFYLSYLSTDSNAGILTWITLPVSQSGLAADRFSVFANTVMNGNSYTLALVSTYIDATQQQKIKVYGFPVTIDGQPIVIMISGEYEVS